MEEAVISAQLAVALSELGGQAEARIGTYFCLAQKRLAQGDLAGAKSEMDKQDQAAQHPTISQSARAVHTAQHVMFALQQDDLAAALEWGDRLAAFPPGLLGFGMQYIPPRLLIARGEKTAAAEQLRSLYEKALQADAQGFIVKIRVYQALAAPTSTEAFTFLSDALRMGNPEGFIRTFVDEGKLLAPLLRKALALGIAPEYTAKLLSIIKAEEQIRKARNGEVPPPPASSALLSERETEILRLVVSGLSNRQIADRLVISLGTAKTHVHNIFEKLDVGSRTQAIGRAKELKLI